MAGSFQSFKHQIIMVFAYTAARIKEERAMDHGLWVKWVNITTQNTCTAANWANRGNDLIDN